MAKTCVIMLSTKIPQLKASAERLAEFAVEATANEAVAHARASMTEPKTGRTYRRGRVSRAASKAYAGQKLRTYETAKGNARVVTGYKFHRASAPGESPAIDTGALLQSFKVRKGGRLVRVIEVAAEPAAWLEFGTCKMAARPFLEPALKAVAGFFHRAMTEIIRQGAA